MAEDKGGRVFVDQSVSSHNQSGGITAHTVQVGRTPRRLNQAPQVQKVLLEQPISKKVEITALYGDHESMSFAGEIMKFLHSHGYSVEAQFPLAPPPYPKGLQVVTGEPITKIIVGINEPMDT